MWLPHSVSHCSFTLPCPASPSELFPFLHQGHSFGRCGCRPAGEGCGRTCFLFSRLLQSSLCHSQGHRGVVSCNRSLAPQPFCRCVSFPYGDSQSVLQSLRLGDWMVSLDLQDAYLQVPAHPYSRRYLRFCVGDSVFQFCSLCFGLSTAPQTFTSVMVPVSSIMHRYGFRILWYLDDWLVLGSSLQEIVRARDFLLWVCQERGIRINIAKSSLTPSQSIDYLGMRLQTCPLRIFPTPKRVLKLSSLVREFVSCQQHPLTFWR